MKLTFQAFLEAHRFHGGEFTATCNVETGLISVPCVCGARWLGVNLQYGPGLVEEAE